NVQFETDWPNLIGRATIAALLHGRNLITNLQIPSSKPARALNASGDTPYSAARFSKKMTRGDVDASGKCASLMTPLDSGTPLIGSSFYVHLGLQIGLNFVPGFEFRHRGKQIVRARDWVFLCS